MGGGQPIIAGTGLRVADLVASHIYRGLTPDELAGNYALDLGQGYAALAYYDQHKTAMDDHLRADAVRAAQLLTDAEAQKRLICAGSAPLSPRAGGRWGRSTRAFLLQPYEERAMECLLHKTNSGT